jgi:spore germination protein GerM
MKPFTVLVSLALAIALLAGCAPSTGGLGPVGSGTAPVASVAPGSPDLTPGPGASSPGSGPTEAPTAPTATPRTTTGAGPVATPGATPSPTQGTTQPSSPAPAVTPEPPATEPVFVRVYFHLTAEDGATGLVPILRQTPATPAVARAALRALLEGPRSAERNAVHPITTAIPTGTRLLDVAIANGVATVDLSREFQSGGGSASSFGRLGQVVYTLTQFPTVTSVEFRIEGRAVTVFGSEGIVIDGPMARADFPDLLPPIWIDRPAYGAALGNPGRASGSANVFEAAFTVTVLDASDRVLLDQPVTATCGTGCRGTWDVTLTYDVPEAQWGTLRVWTASAEDGLPEMWRDYPVWLTPAD